MRTCHCAPADGSASSARIWADATLGVLGLGNIGSAVARIGKAFGMTVIAWSQNLTADRAAAVRSRAGLEGRAFSAS